MKPKFVTFSYRCKIIEWINCSGVDRSGSPDDHEWLSPGLLIGGDRAI